MLKKLVLMFAFLTTAGVNAVVEDNVSSESSKTASSEASRPGILKRGYNFCWGERSAEFKQTVLSITFLPGVFMAISGIIHGFSSDLNEGKRKKYFKWLFFASLPILSHISMVNSLFAENAFDPLNLLK